MLTSPARAIATALSATALAITVGVSSGGTPSGSGSSTSPETPVAATSPARPPAPGSHDASVVSVAPWTNKIPGDDRPNILVIMSDDMREDELRLMPHVERLIAGRGVHFLNSFSPYPLCCPARSSFLSGQYTHNHGVWGNKPPYGFLAFHDRSTVATDLAAAGYQTAMFGKYLNGYGEDPAPDGSAPDSYHYVPPGWEDWRGASRHAYSYYQTMLNHNGALEGSRGIYQTRYFGHETADMVAELAQSPRPFFLWASYVAPHVGLPVEKDDPKQVLMSDGTRAPVTTPARPGDAIGVFDHKLGELPHMTQEHDLSDKPSFVREQRPLNAAETKAVATVEKQRAEALYVLDQEVGRTVKELKAVGELDNTLIVFTSDNGYLLAEHGFVQGKRLPYENSLRVPTVMAGPGIPHGQSRRDPIMILDLAPTFLDAAGARTSRPMDGVSMLGVARHGDRGWTRPVFTESSLASLPKNHLPLMNRRPQGPNPLRFAQGIRTARYLYVEYATRERELYDLQRDPLELTNIVDRPDMKGVVAQLAAVLEHMRTCRAATCQEPLPESLQSH